MFSIQNSNLCDIVMAFPRKRTNSCPDLQNEAVSRTLSAIDDLLAGNGLKDKQKGVNGNSRSFPNLHRPTQTAAFPSRKRSSSNSDLVKKLKKIADNVEDKEAPESKSHTDLHHNNDISDDSSSTESAVINHFARALARTNLSSSPEHTPKLRASKSQPQLVQVSSLCEKLEDSSSAMDLERDNSVDADIELFLKSKNLGSKPMKDRNLPASFFNSSKKIPRKQNLDNFLNELVPNSPRSTDENKVSLTSVQEIDSEPQLPSKFNSRQQEQVQEKSFQNLYQLKNYQQKLHERTSATTAAANTTNPVQSQANQVLLNPLMSQNIYSKSSSVPSLPTQVNTTTPPFQHIQNIPQGSQYAFNRSLQHSQHLQSVPQIYQLPPSQVQQQSQQYPHLYQQQYTNHQRPPLQQQHSAPTIQNQPQQQQYVIPISITPGFGQQHEQSNIAQSPYQQQEQQIPTMVQQQQQQQQQQQLGIYLSQQQQIQQQQVHAQRQSSGPTATQTQVPNQVSTLYYSINQQNVTSYPPFDQNVHTSKSGINTPCHTPPEFQNTQTTTTTPMPALNKQSQCQQNDILAGNDIMADVLNELKSEGDILTSMDMLLSSTTCT
eukprot:Awhi_evm1s7319